MPGMLAKYLSGLVWRGTVRGAPAVVPADVVPVQAQEVARVEGEVVGGARAPVRVVVVGAVAVAAVHRLDAGLEHRALVTGIERDATAVDLVGGIDLVVGPQRDVGVVAVAERCPGRGVHGRIAEPHGRGALASLGRRGELVRGPNRTRLRHG